MSQQTPRRSRRSQPFVPTPIGPSDVSELTWVGDEIASAPTVGERDVPGDVILDENRDWMNHYFSAFTRPMPTKGIVGGRKGKAVASDLRFSVGDTVIVQGLHRETHVGAIAALWEVSADSEEDGDDVETFQCALVHWFLQHKDMKHSERLLQDEELCYTVDQAAVVLASSLFGHCNVVAPEEYDATQTNGFSVPRQTWLWQGEKEDFFCNKAYKDGLSFHLDWAAHRELATVSSLRNPELASELWNLEVPAGASRGKVRHKTSAQKQSVPSQPLARKTAHKRSPSPASSSSSEEAGSDSDKDEYTQVENDREDEELSDGAHASSDEDVDMSDGAEEDDSDSRSPSKKRKRGSQPQTPSKRNRTSRTKVALTPSSKATLVARKQRKGRLRISQPKTYETARADRDALLKLPKDAHLRAMHLLHVAARPDALPGRSDEFNEVLGSVVEVLEEGSGGCIYISGVPGTGKTATVHAVVRELQQMARDNLTSPFTYVEINGLRLPEPSAAYAVLWEAVSGHDVAKEGRLKVSAKEALKRLDQYFSGSRIGPSGGAYVVLMDELDQLVTDKKDVVYNFFNWPSLRNSRLVVIAVSNTHDLPERVLPPKVQSRLGMERIRFHPYSRDQLIEIVTARLDASREGLDVEKNVINDDAVKYASARVAAVNGDARRVLDICRRAVETVHVPNGQSRTVRMPEITAVIKDMQNSPVAAYVKDLSFGSRLVLAALLKCVKREGVNEVKWGDVIQQCTILFEQLRDDPALQKPVSQLLRRVLEGLFASKTVILETGTQAERKFFEDRLVMLGLESGEVVRALSDVGGSKWENVLGT